MNMNNMNVMNDMNDVGATRAAPTAGPTDVVIK